MSFHELEQALHKLRVQQDIDHALEVVAYIVKLLGVDSLGYEEILNLASVQREVGKFLNAPGYRNQPAAYEIPFESQQPFDIKLFWVHKTTKANLTWLTALTPNFEDNPVAFELKNIGLDFVVSADCSSLYIILTREHKLRVLELKEKLSNTQKEILESWRTKISKQLDPKQENYKALLHKHLWESFDYEPLNKEFYKKLSAKFEELSMHLTLSLEAEAAKIFTVRLIGRLLFVWFLNKKQFLNESMAYFEVADLEDPEYYRTKLEPLFYEVLNKEVEQRTYPDARTPFLNGGLFEPIESDYYQSTTHDITFPQKYFEDFYRILHHYNFTVDEGTSEYQQVAIDPEMLGRVFENLLASLNEDTGEQARKAKGAFYTPRTVVDYMCSQSLIEYLKTKLPETPERDRHIVDLVTMDEASFREQDHNKRHEWRKKLGQELVLQALDELTILDPAVGSGAFPMGMLNLLLKVYTRIDTALESDLEHLKKRILANSIYGCDIDQMAILIAKLRSYLSIIVDVDPGTDQAPEPLPNLEFKFVCANTLIALEDEENDGLFGEQDIYSEVKRLSQEYFSATTKTAKERLRKEYLQVLNSSPGLSISTRQQKLTEYRPFDQLNSTNFYDPGLMHGVDHFHIVLGNPPYVQLQKRGGYLADMYQDQGYDTFARTGDIYSLFYERGYELLTDHGILAYITSNKWMRAGYGQKTREFFAKKTNPLVLLDLGPNVFETATVDTNILLLSKDRNRGQTRATKLAGGDIETAVEQAHTIDFNSGDGWFIGSPAEMGLKAKIERLGTPLKDWDVEINRGILTGYNKAFIINEEKRAELIAQDPKSAEIIKPILRGKDIKKYHYKHAGLYLINTHNGVKSKRISRINVEEYPAIQEHLKNHEPKLSKRGDKGDTPYNLRNCAYIEEFEKEKIIYPETTQSNNFAYSIDTMLVDKTAFILVGSELIYILAILCSNVFNYAYKNLFAGITLGSEGYQFNKVYLEGFPLLKINQHSEDLVIEIKNSLKAILKLKSENKSTRTQEQIMNRLVYQLYELTEEEIALIEDATK